MARRALQKATTHLSRAPATARPRYLRNYGIAIAVSALSLFSEMAVAESAPAVPTNGRGQSADLWQNLTLDFMMSTCREELTDKAMRGVFPESCDIEVEGILQTRTDCATHFFDAGTETADKIQVFLAGCFPRIFFDGQRFELINSTLENRDPRQITGTRADHSFIASFLYRVEVCTDRFEVFTGLLSMRPEGTALYALMTVPSVCARD